MYDSFKGGVSEQTLFPAAEILISTWGPINYTYQPNHTFRQ